MVTTRTRNAKAQQATAAVSTANTDQSSAHQVQQGRKQTRQLRQTRKQETPSERDALESNVDINFMEQDDGAADEPTKQDTSNNNSKLSRRARLRQWKQIERERMRTLSTTRGDVRPTTVISRKRTSSEQAQQQELDVDEGNIVDTAGMQQDANRQIEDEVDKENELTQDNTGNDSVDVNNNSVKFVEKSSPINPQPPRPKRTRKQKEVSRTTMAKITEDPIVIREDPDAVMDHAEPTYMSDSLSSNDLQRSQSDPIGFSEVPNMVLPLGELESPTPVTKVRKVIKEPIRSEELESITIDPTHRHSSSSDGALGNVNAMYQALERQHQQKQQQSGDINATTDKRAKNKGRRRVSSVIREQARLRRSSSVGVVGERYAGGALLPNLGTESSGGATAGSSTNGGAGAMSNGFSSHAVIRAQIAARSALEVQVVSLTRRLQILTEQTPECAKCAGAGGIEAPSPQVETNGVCERSPCKRARNASDTLESAVFELGQVKEELEAQVANHAKETRHAAARHKDEMTKLQTQLRQLRSQVRKATECAAEQHVESMHALRRSEATRRDLHEQVMSIKGNIRVYCRVRPPSGSNVGSTSAGEAVLSIADGLPGQPSTTVLVRGAATTGVDGSAAPGRSWKFTFDHVFDTDASQAHVFDHVKAMVQSALDGHNVCVFAYGQTGSGKTFSMFGPPSSAEPGEVGLIPRAIRALFAGTTYQDNQQQNEKFEGDQNETGTRRNAFGWEFDIAVCCLEIYNESIRDLLPREEGVGGNSSSFSASVSIPIDAVLEEATQDPAFSSRRSTRASSRRRTSIMPSSNNINNISVSTTSASSQQQQQQTQQNQQGHSIRHHADGTTTVSGITLWAAPSAEKVLTLLGQAAKNRVVAKTKCNDRSSRSHTVFSLHLTAKHTDQESGASVVKRSVVHFVDLAGSERLNDSASGDNKETLKETQAINSSLSTLGTTISALAEKREHVPFRNSKLTYLLQNALGGSCKTLMLCNLSPESAHVPESLCSLRFASKVGQCTTGGST